MLDRGEGLDSRWLGKNQRKVLDVIGDNELLSCGDIHARVGVGGAIIRTHIYKSLEALCARGYLDREESGGRVRYKKKLVGVPFPLGPSPTKPAPTKPTADDLRAQIEILRLQLELLSIEARRDVVKEEIEKRQTAG